MNELELIQCLTAMLPQNDSVVVGPGDDCAVLDVGLPDAYLLFKTDAVVEGVHFTAGTDPEKIGRKALARCLSDIAAMAGTPTHALVTLGLPASFDPATVQAIYRGLVSLASRHRVAVVGGETTVNPGGIMLSLALLGRVAKTRCLRRTGSRPGDAIFVTGELGGSIGGKHLDFEPRLEEAAWLAGQFDIHAMIDLSDGLAGDLRHLLEAGGIGAEILATSLPLSRAARLQLREGRSSKPALLAALTDGEDFELLFTLPSKLAVPLVDAWKLKFPRLKLTCIGKITGQPGVILRDRDGVKPFPQHGHVHFS